MSNRRNSRKRRERATHRTESIRNNPESARSSTLLGTTTEPTFTLDPPRFATKKTIAMIPQFPLEHPAHGSDHEGSGANGEYQATFILGVPGFWNAQPDPGASVVDRGDSLIEVEPQIASFQMYLEDPENPEAPHQATVAINQHHHLKYIRTTIKADGFSEARRLAHDLVMPTISRLAYVHDVAIDVAVTEVIDLTSQAFSFTMKNIGAVQKFSDFHGRTSDGQERLLSVYRHGISSTEPAFQALSFFRVIEACYRLRGNRITETKERGEQPNEPSEVFPVRFDEIAALGYENNDEPAFRPYLAMKFTRARGILNDRVRNLLAHLDVNSEILHLDDFDDTIQVERVVPVLHYMARTLLGAELPHFSNEQINQIDGAAEEQP